MQCSLCYRGRLHAPADYACSLRAWSKVAKNELSPPLCRSGIEVASKSPPDTLAEDSTADTLSSKSMCIALALVVCGWTFRRSRCLRVSAASCCLIIFSFEKGAALLLNGPKRPNIAHQLLKRHHLFPPPTLYSICSSCRRIYLLPSQDSLRKDLFGLSVARFWTKARLIGSGRSSSHET